MAILRKCLYANIADIIVSSMNLIISDTDKVDVWITYLEDGVKFYGWGGDVGVEVKPSQIGGSDTYNVKYYFYVGKSRLVKEVIFEIDNVIQMTRTINEWIQNG